MLLFFILRLCFLHLSAFVDGDGLVMASHRPFPFLYLPTFGSFSGCRFCLESYRD
jgi:hypothetical protein